MAASKKKTIKVVTTNKASDFRDSPSSSGKKVGTFKKGEDLEYVTVTKDPKNPAKKWYKLKNGKYVSSANVGAPHEKTVKDKSSDSSSSKKDKSSSDKKKNKEKLMDAKELDAELKELVDKQTKTLETMVDGSMKMFGLPHQLTPNNDYRLSKKTLLGTMFTQTFIVDAPVLYIKPGKSKFLPGMSKTEKKNTLNMLINAASGNDISKNVAKALSNVTGEDWRYFDFSGDYASYMADVSWMCKIGAVFLGINKKKVPWEEQNGRNVTYGTYDWSGYKFSALFMSQAKMTSTAKKGKHDALALMKKTLTKVLDDDDYVQFYIDANSSFGESASNQTTDSMITSYMDQLSSVGQELSFVSGLSGLNIDKLVNSSTSNIDTAVQNIAQGDGAVSKFLKRLTGVGKQVLSGSSFLAPEIWSSSSYSKSYSFSVSLATPYGTKEAWYLNIFVPLMHLLCLALPRQTSANTYSSPRLIRAFSPGWFSCDLGIMDSITIDKGGSGDAYSASGLPNEIKVSVSMKDLYADLALPSGYDIKSFFSNTGLIDYLMVNCGVNITKQSFDDKIAVMCTLFVNGLSAAVKETVSEFFEDLNEAVRKVFNLFK